jgi:hypothetical protein
MNGSFENSDHRSTFCPIKLASQRSLDGSGMSSDHGFVFVEDDSHWATGKAKTLDDWHLPLDDGMMTRDGLRFTPQRHRLRYIQDRNPGRSFGHSFRTSRRCGR